MTKLFYQACFMTALMVLVVESPHASNLTNPDYPLSAAEQLYADLAKLPASERHAKIVAGAKKEGKFEMVHAMTGTLGRNHTKFFRKSFSYIDIAEASLGSNNAMERLISEERAGRHITDVISSTELTELTHALESGILARYPTPVAERVLPQYRTFFDPHHRWLLTHFSEQGISYNTKMIKEMGVEPPTAWMDLCRPEFKGQVSWEPIRTRILLFLYTMFGEEKYVEFLKCMGENEPILMKGKTVRLTLMMSGDHAIQGHNFFYKGTLWVHQKGEKKVPFKAVYSTPVLGSGAGCVINRNTQNPYTSALYCDWNLDEEGQAYLKSQYRGAVTLKHAFLPEDAQLINLMPADLETVNKIQGYWNQYVVRNKKKS